MNQVRPGFGISKVFPQLIADNKESFHISEIYVKFLLVIDQFPYKADFC